MGGSLLDIGGDPIQADDIDANPVPGQLQCHHFREGNLRSLDARIRGRSGVVEDASAVHRGGDHDRTSLLPKQWDTGAGDQERPRQVSGRRVIPLLKRQIIDGCPHAVRAGIDDDETETTPGLPDRGNRALEIGLTGDICQK